MELLDIVDENNELTGVKNVIKLIKTVVNKTNV